MNTTLDLITYETSSVSMDDETLLATGFVALATLAIAVMQHCGPSGVTKKAQPLRISIPTLTESAPPTPTPTPSPTPPTLAPPPPAPTRVRHKRLRSSENEDDLDPRILRVLQFNPGATAKEIHTMVKKKDPSLTKSDINSRLYTMLNTKVLTKEGNTGTPSWFLV